MPHHAAPGRVPASSRCAGITPGLTCALQAATASPAALATLIAAAFLLAGQRTLRPGQRHQPRPAAGQSTGRIEEPPAGEAEHRERPLVARRIARGRQAIGVGRLGDRRGELRVTGRDAEDMPAGGREAPDRERGRVDSGHGLGVCDRGTPRQLKSTRPLMARSLVTRSSNSRRLASPRGDPADRRYPARPGGPSSALLFTAAASMIRRSHKVHARVGIHPPASELTLDMARPREDTLDALPCTVTAFGASP